MPPAGLAGRPDHDALLAAVIADLDSDTPRLVYADYLEENGDEPDAARAEFIRLQCPIARRERTAPVAEGDAAWERAAELADEFGPEWRRRMPTIAGVVWGFGGRGGVGTAWRGFPEVVFEAPSVIPHTWEAVRECAPMGCVGLAALGQSALWGQFASGANAPYRVARLPLRRPQAAGYVADLFARPGVRSWRGLTLSDAGSLHGIAECANLAALEWLRFLVPAGTAPDLSLFPRLFDSPGPPKLAWFEVRTHAGELLACREVGRG